MHVLLMLLGSIRQSYELCSCVSDVSFIRRLFLARSRMQEYLSHLGQTVLDSFPAQATLHFYNDEDSSSEDEADTH